MDLRLIAVVCNAIFACIAIALDGAAFNGENIQRCTKDGCDSVEVSTSAVHAGLSFFGTIASLIAGSILLMVRRGGLQPAYRHGSTCTFLVALVFVGCSLGLTSQYVSSMAAGETFIPLHQSLLAFLALTAISIIFILFLEIALPEKQDGKSASFNGGVVGQSSGFGAEKKKKKAVKGKKKVERQLEDISSDEEVSTYQSPDVVLTES